MSDRATRWGVVLLAPMLIGCSSGGSSIEFHDLGEFKPGQPIMSTLAVVNPFDEPALVTGLSDACSVRVENRTNGVVAPRERIPLRLLAQASRMPGPALFKLEVAFEASGKKRSTFHSFRYDVPAIPMLSRSQVWIGTQSDGLDVIGMSEGDRILIEAPNGITPSIADRHVEFGGHVDQTSHLGRATVVVERPGDKEIRLGVDLFEPEDPTCRFYPSALWSRGGACKCMLVGMRGPGTLQVTPAGSATLVRRRDELTIRPTTRPAGKITVEWRGSNKASARLRVGVQR